jgi:hypothetical protein
MSIPLEEIFRREAMADIEEEERVLHEIENAGADHDVPSPKQKKVSFSYELDMTLLLETTTSNPFKTESKWSEVASNVTEHHRAISKDDSFILSSRTCKERVILLLKTLALKTEASVKKLKR